MRRRAFLLGALGVLVVPLRAWAQTTVLPMATRAAGTYAFTQITVPVNVRGLVMMLDVSQATDPLPQLAGLLEGSLDGGTIWEAAGSFTRIAGPKGLDKQGAVLTTLGAQFLGGTFWNDVANANRRLRGAATITGGSLRFAMTVTTL